MSRDVNDQVTDGVTQANFTVLGTGPSIAIVQTELSLAQAQGVLFANMVSNQQNLALSTNAAMTEGIMQLLGGGKRKVVTTKGKPDDDDDDRNVVLGGPLGQPPAPENNGEDGYEDAIMSLMVR